MSDWTYNALFFSKASIIWYFVFFHSVIVPVSFVRTYLCGHVIELVIKHRFKLLLPAEVKPTSDGAILSEIEMLARGNYVQGRGKMKSEVVFSLREALHLDQADWKLWSRKHLNICEDCVCKVYVFWMFDSFWMGKKKKVKEWRSQFCMSFPSIHKEHQCQFSSLSLCVNWVH